MKKIFLIIASLSLLITSFSIAYYLVIFLPQKENTQKAYNLELRKLQIENSNIQNTLNDIQSSTNKPGITSEDVQSSVQDTINQELQNQANCERLGGKYQGNHTCVYY
jgi:type II secretory pathway component PulM